MVDKCCKFGVKNILVFGLVFTTRVSLEVLEKIHEKLSTFCSGYGLIYIDNRNIRGMHLSQGKLHLQQPVIYIDNRNIRGVHLCQDNLHLLQSGKKFSCNYFIS